MLAKIERFGLESIPTTLKTARWYDYSIMQFAFSFNAGNFLLPALAVTVGGLSFWWAVASILLGNFLAYLCVAIYAIPGVDYGIPGQYAIRSSLGTAGSRFFSSPLRALTSVYWFAVQSLGAAVVIQAMLIGLGITFISEIPIAIIFALLMTWIAVMGFDAVSKAIRIVLPLMVLNMVILSVIFLRSEWPAFQWSYVSSSVGENRWSIFFLYAGLAFAQYVASLSGSADICRYARTRKDAFLGLVSGNFIGLAVTACLTAYAAKAIGEWNPYVAATAMTDSYLVHMIILCGVIISMFCINLNNAYTGGFSLLNTFPKLSRISATALIGASATILCLAPAVISQAQFFISVLGSFAVPLAGVVIVDYLLIKRMKVDIPSLHQKEGGLYSYWHGLNLSACLSMVIGFIFFHLAPDHWAPGLSSCLLAGLLYAGLNQPLFKRREASIEG